MSMNMSQTEIQLCLLQVSSLSGHIRELLEPYILASGTKNLLIKQSKRKDSRAMHVLFKNGRSVSEEPKFLK